MKVSQSNARPVAHAFQWRALISVILLLSFLMMFLSGAGLWVAPPGRIAHWTDWTILGMRKDDWSDVHMWFGVLFVAASAFHLVLNWRSLLGYFRRKATRHIGFRREWLAAALLCAAVFAGTRMELPPFSTLLAFTEDFRLSWEEAEQRPPIPHAELMTVTELTERAGIRLENALVQLTAHDVRGASPEMRLAELARLNQVSAHQIYEIMTAGAQPAQNRGRGADIGGGYGQWTLAAFCEREGVDLQTAQSRLKAKDLDAAADLTLREIAAQGGYERPCDILIIIRGNWMESN